jgi:hypothetical protein
MNMQEEEEEATDGRMDEFTDNLLANREREEFVK